MKFKITLNQKVLAKSNLDLINCAILDWLIVICNSKNPALEQKRIKGMTWVDYKTLLKDMPLLRIKSPSALTPRFRKIEQGGYIKCAIIGSRGHWKMYVSIEKKVDELFTDVNTKSVVPTKMNIDVHDDECKETSGVHEGEQIMILGTHNSTNDSNVSAGKEIKELSGFEQFWSVYPKKELKKKSAEIWSNKKLDAKLPEIITFISEAKKTERWLRGFIKQPTAFLAGECWKDDLSAYGGTSQPVFKPWVGDSTDDYNKKSIQIINSKQ